LAGQVITSNDTLSTCQPYLSFNTSVYDPTLFFLPCGFIAQSLFTDTFILKNEEGRIINVTKKGIAWDSDISIKYNNPPPDTPGIRTIPDFRDEDFIVWMRNAGLPKFRKLNRIIQEDLYGNYVVEIYNSYDVTLFQGSKSIIISQTSFLGGKNNFLGYAYMAVGGLCFLCGVIFSIAQCACGRKPGDLRYLQNQLN